MFFMSWLDFIQVWPGLTDFTGFRVLNPILHVLCLLTRKINDFTSQNSFLTTMLAILGGVKSLLLRKLLGLFVVSFFVMSHEGRKIFYYSLPILSPILINIFKFALFTQFHFIKCKKLFFEVLEMSWKKIHKVVRGVCEVKIHSKRFSREWI